MDKELNIGIHYHEPLNTQAAQKDALKLQNFQIVSGAGSFLMNNSPSRLFWYSFRETTTTLKAVFKIMDGSNPNGKIISTFSLNPGESTRDSFAGKYGAYVEEGIYFWLVSGTVEGNIMGTLESDYQADYTAVKVLNYPTQPVYVNE